VNAPPGGQGFIHGEPPSHMSLSIMILMVMPSVSIAGGQSDLPGEKTFYIWETRITDSPVVTSFPVISRGVPSCDIKYILTPASDLVVTFSPVQADFY
jgi:hypothetical protein